MPTYAIGDIQGCYGPLQRLLKRIAFSASQDKLWLVGDLVNRGPQSLEVLRFLRDLGDRVVAVLGNHDLHLLAIHAGVRKLKKHDTLAQILDAPDCDALLDWLRHRPLLHRHGEYVLLHGGLLPQWTVDEAESLAKACSTALQGPQRNAVLQAYFVANGRQWHETLDATLRLGLAMQIFTRMRACSPEGIVADDFKGPRNACPPGTQPWFEIPGRRSQNATLVVGHWAALGLHLAPGIMALDSGCVWGGQLTALRLEDGQIFQEPA